MDAAGGKWRGWRRVRVARFLWVAFRRDCSCQSGAVVRAPGGIAGMIAAWQYERAGTIARVVWRVCACVQWDLQARARRVGGATTSPARGIVLTL